MSAPRTPPGRTPASSSARPREVFVYSPETGDCVAHIYELPPVGPLLVQPARIGGNEQ